MNKVAELLKQLIPQRFRSRRFLLDDYHFDLTSFDGDVTEWLSKFPITTTNAEIYFALAELFRRRGEFDKAVSVHEAIINSSIEGYSLSELTLEVAQDYYAAGVLGHAEEVLVKALEDADEKISRQAFRLWLAILESEQDWERAVTLVEQYGLPGSGGLRLANLYSEFVTSQWRERPKSGLLKVLRKARRLGVSSRVELLIAELLNDQGRLQDAILVYRDLLFNDPRRVNLVLPALKHLSMATDSQDDLLRFLIKLYKRHPSVRILEAIIEIYKLETIPLSSELESAVSQQVKAGDSILVMQYWREKQPELAQRSIDEIMPALQRHSLNHVDDNVCMECGFYSEKMVWLCPQCESWETMFSRYELRIEQQLKNVT